MTAAVAKSRAEIYDMVRQTRQDALQQHPTRITVRAPGLNEDARTNLQAEIQAVVDRALQRATPVPARSYREPPTEEQDRRAISKQLKQLRSAPPKEPRQRPARQGGIRVSMSSLPLSTEDRRALQSEVRQLVRDRLNSAAATRGQQQTVVCGCTWPYWFQPCCSPQTPSDLSGLGPFGDPSDPSTPPVFINWTPDVHIFDVDDVLMISMFPWDRHDPAPLPPNQIVAGIRISSAVEPGMWPKEMQGWQYCMCGVGPIAHQETSTPFFRFLLLEQDTVDTLLFRKKTVYGMSDVFSLDPATFWNLFGGWTMTFDWLQDGSFRLNP